MVIGGGIVGLACAEQLSRKRNTSTLLLEKHQHLGFETTSRNSQVIHAGIYYPVDSLKAKLCIKGKITLYELCEKHQIAHRKCGKWIIAAPEEQDLSYLDDIHKKATHLGVETYFLDKRKIASEEPLVRAGTVLVSPTTGIVDSHGVLDHLNFTFTQGNAEKGLGSGDIAKLSKVVWIERDSEGNWIVEVEEQAVGNNSQPSRTRIKTRVLVNSAGLYADEIASMAMGSQVALKLGYKLYPVKGRYYSYSPSRPLAKRLLYPAPEKNFAGLGIHLTLDLMGRAKFGPDVTYVDSKDEYSMDDNDLTSKKKFWESVRRYLPVVEMEDIYADYAGIR